MNKANRYFQRLLAVFLAIAVVMIVTPANAGKRNDSTGKRDVITDAAMICPGAWDDLSVAACDLVFATNGKEDGETKGCPVDADFDGIDNEIVTYRLRNCEKNEEALLRLASSAVLSIDDWVTRGKGQQAQTAANYLCAYSSKFMILGNAGKLYSSEDLASDAELIVANLGLFCEI